MALRVSHTTVNPKTRTRCRSFGQLLGYAEDPHDSYRPDHEEYMIFSPDLRHRLLFIQVDQLVEPGRVHFDLVPVDGSRDDELERVRSLGAVEMADRRQHAGRGWVVFGDPEGITLCVLRPASCGLRATERLLVRPLVHSLDVGVVRQSWLPSPEGTIRSTTR